MKEKILDTDHAFKTPSSIADIHTNNNSSYMEDVAFVAKAKGIFKEQNAEVAERQVGNMFFERGNFSAAVKSYTKCLGLKSENVIAFSNRAMAYIKLKEYYRAIWDCTNALGIDESHIKSLHRRATAYNCIGQHRLALKDLEKAEILESNNKVIHLDKQKTREMLRNAVSRAFCIRLQSPPLIDGLLEDT